MSLPDAVADREQESSSPRCSVRSLQAGESLAGTASTVRSWILLEQPGPWGVSALLDSRLPDGLGGRLEEVAADLGLRVLLIRRYGRGATNAARSCFLISSRPGRTWAEQVRLAAPQDLLDLDLSALARGERLGLAPMPMPLFLVCTHGRHDPCCAERGRPLAAVLAERFPDQTWECSHVGGDRFAGNLLGLPDGLYFGRVSPDEAVAVAQGYAEGRISLPHYRGRSAYPFPIQAAEIYLRASRATVGLDELRWVSGQQEPDAVTARFADRTGRSFAVRVRAGVAPARLLSCQDEVATRAPVFDLLDITEA